MPAVEPPVERIAVLRALMLGDMLCATPVLRALRAGFPQARITLVGLGWARGLAERLASVDDFVELPGWPGLPEATCHVRALPDFLATMQSRRFDLALQMHGSGRLTNPLLATFGARTTAGFFDAVSWRPPADAANWVPWPDEGHEVERLLSLTDRLALPRQGLQLDFPLRDADRADLLAAWPGLHDAGPYVVVHAGAQLPSRRWPVQRFAAVADRLYATGHTVVLTGGAPESGLVNALAATMRAPSVNLVGRTSLWSLGALVERAERVVCNDTGVSHVAAALGTPSVVVSCGADVRRWSPLDAQRHRVLWQPMACRPCSHVDCPIGHGCATVIEVDDVMRALDALDASMALTADGAAHAA